MNQFRQRDSYYEVGSVGRAMDLLEESTSVQFEAVIELAGHIEPDRMRRAWSRLRDLHPLLRATRTSDGWEPSATSGPVEFAMAKSDAGHTLRLTCDHVAFDGLGSLMLLGDLRSLYTSDSEPAPDWSARNFEDAQPTTGSRLDMAAATRAAFRWQRAPVSTHRDPAREIPHQPSESHYVMELGGLLAEMTEVRRRLGWSTDALLVGVLEQAWTEVFGPPAERSVWMVAQDFRPDLGLTRGLGNLSLIDTVAAAGSVSATAASVTAQLSRQRSDLLRGALLGARFGSVGRQVLEAAMARGRRLRYFRSLSNVGQLGDTLDEWGTARAARVYFVGPMAHPPYSSFIAAGRGDSVLVTVRTSSSWLSDDHARDLEAAAIDASSAR